MPRVTVIMPCYNAMRYVGEALGSLLSQSEPDWECIVIDDGSTDASVAVVSQIGDSRIRLLCQQNQGPGAARNKGVEAAQGEFIAFLDADDLALPGRLRGELAVFEANPGLAVVGSGYIWIDEQGREIPWSHSWKKYPELNRLRDWLYDCPFVPSAVMMRREAYRQVGGIAEDLRGGEDWHLWMRLVLGGYRLGWHREVACHYRHHPQSLSQNAPSMSRDCTEALRRVLQRPDFPTALGQDGRQALALRYVDGVKRLFTAGLWAEGHEMLIQALALDATLVSGRPSRMEDELVVAAIDPLTADPLTFLGQALANLPPGAAPLAQRQKAMAIRCHIEMAARAVKGGSPWEALRHGYPVFAANPTWLVDRNVWALAIRALRNRARAALDRLRGTR